MRIDRAISPNAMPTQDETTSRQPRGIPLAITPIGRSTAFSRSQFVRALLKHSAPNGTRASRMLNATPAYLAGLPDVSTARARWVPLSDPAQQAQARQTLLADLDQQWLAPSNTVGSPKKQHQDQITKSIRENADFLHKNDKLTLDGYDVVNQILIRPDAKDRVAKGTYGLTFESTDIDGITSHVPLNIVAMTAHQSHSPRATGTAVLHIPGEQGGLREFQTLEQAQQWLTRELKSDSTFTTALLDQLPHETAEQLRSSIAVDALGQPQLSFHVKPINGNVFSYVAESQFSAYKQVISESDGTPQPINKYFSTSLGEQSMELETIRDNQLLVESTIPDKIKNHPEYKHLIQLLTIYKTKENEYVKIAGDVPNLNQFSSRKIREKIRNDLSEKININRLVVAIPSSKSFMPPGAGAMETPPESWPKIPLVTALQYKLPELVPDFSQARISSSDGEPVPAAFTADYVTQLSKQLDLGEQYNAMLDRRLVVPETGKLKHSQELMKLNKANLDYEILYAKMNGDISDDEYRLLSAFIDAQQSNKTSPLEFQELLIEGNSLIDVFIFTQRGSNKLIVFMPGAPDGKNFRTFDNNSKMATFLKAISSKTEDELEMPSGHGGESAVPAASWQDFLRSRIPIYDKKQLDLFINRIHKGASAARTELRRVKGNFFDKASHAKLLQLKRATDSQTISKKEKKLENLKDFVQIAKGILSFVPYAGPVIVLSDVSHRLLNAYSSWQQGDTDSAREYGLSALTGLLPDPAMLARGGVKPTRDPGRVHSPGFLQKLVRQRGPDGKVRIGIPLSGRGGKPGASQASPGISRPTTKPVSQRFGLRWPKLGVFDTLLRDQPIPEASYQGSVARPGLTDQFSVSWVDKKSTFQPRGDELAQLSEQGDVKYSGVFKADLFRNDYTIILKSEGDRRIQLSNAPSDISRYPAQKIAQLETHIPDPDLRARISEVATQTFSHDAIEALFKDLLIPDVNFRSVEASYEIRYDDQGFAQVDTNFNGYLWRETKDGELERFSGIQVQIKRGISIYKLNDKYVIDPAAPINYDIIRKGEVIPAHDVPRARVDESRLRFDPSTFLYLDTSGNRYIKIADEFFQVRDDKQLGTKVIVDPDNPFGFKSSNPVKSTPYGLWEIVDQPGLEGGGPSLSTTRGKYAHAEAQLKAFLDNPRTADDLSETERRDSAASLTSLLQTSNAETHQSINEYNEAGEREINAPLRNGQTTPATTAFLGELKQMNSFQGKAYRRAMVTAKGAAKLKNGVGKTFMDTGIQSASTQPFNAFAWDRWADHTGPAEANQRVMYVFDESIPKKNLSTGHLPDHVAVAPDTLMKVMATKEKDGVLFVYMSFPTRLPEKVFNPFDGTPQAVY
ncbi:dermonecrotic toxin domain-containing protein [Dyella sp.]|uniref:dermonecrotic toxin domain-containing protein n=1 Tax=Dyella sp. TaxID=1869338 RepID=UPI002ED1A671